MGPSTLAAPPATPESVCHAFAAALNAGDLAAASACFSREGCLITPDATAVRGREGIRTVLAQLSARHVQVSVESSAITTAADVALAHERWRIRSAGAEGAAFVQNTVTTLVLRRIEDEWKLSIAAPWGLGR